jgi:hypothetical protein
MNDILYVGIAFVFFLASWGIVTMCDRLGDQKSGDHV